MNEVTHQIKQMCMDAGAEFVGIASAVPVGHRAIDFYNKWIENGFHGSMDYMERWGGIRDDVRELMENAVSVVVCLFNYHTDLGQADGAPHVAMYARGRDYHKVLRKQLGAVAKAMEKNYACNSRVCVDTAPLRERYWAARAGLGVIGLNNQLIVPGKGSHYFIGSIVTTLPLEYDTPLNTDAGQGLVSCDLCGACVIACPTGALDGKGGCDTRKCLSYLTIESKDHVDYNENLHGHIYGCDTCSNVCPHIKGATTTQITDFAPRKKLLDMTLDDWLHLTQQIYGNLLNGSAMRRASCERLVELARALEAQKKRR